MPDIKAIIECLDDYIQSHDYTPLYAPEANQLLARKDLLRDDNSNSGKPLRIYLRKELLPHALQANNSTWVIPHSKSYDNLLDLLGRQHFICSLMNDNLQVVNYINGELWNDLKSTRGKKYFILTAYQHYRTIIIDLVSLFAGNIKGNNRNSFHELLLNKYRFFIGDELYQKIQLILNASITLLEQFKNLRDKQMAHYDFKNGISLKIDFELLKEANELSNRAKLILNLCGGLMTSEIRPLGTLDSLKRFINQFNKLNQTKK